MAKKKKKKLILIVDDEPHIVELIRITLTDEYDFLEALNGNDAFDKAIKHKPDLILLDIMMPGMDGYEVAKKLLARQDMRKTIIAMVSAKKEDHDILTGIDSGAIAYITKPFNPYELQDKVRELLSLTD